MHAGLLNALGCSWGPHRVGPTAQRARSGACLWSPAMTGLVPALVAEALERARVVTTCLGGSAPWFRGLCRHSLLVWLAPWFRGLCRHSLLVWLPGARCCCKVLQGAAARCCQVQGAAAAWWQRCACTESWQAGRVVANWAPSCSRPVRNMCLPVFPRSRMGCE